jgi:hypothetical protein
MGRHSNRHILVCLAVSFWSLLASCRWSLSCLGFATLSPVKLSLQSKQFMNSASSQGSTKVADQKEEERTTEEEEFKDRLKVSNNTLEFSFGEPDVIIPGVTHGQPYVTCFVEYQDRNTRDDEGTVQAKDVLEEWVMRGDFDTVNRFKSWRHRSSDVMNTRCVQTGSKSLEDATCLECIAPSPSFNGAGVPGAIVGTLHSSSVMTFNGLRHCLTRTGGFCKAGTVTLPHF